MNSSLENRSPFVKNARFSVRPGSARAWILAARPKTLPASIAPVIVGSACAWESGSFSVGPAVAALIGGLLLQTAANLANDLFDFEKGADTQTRLGPPRAVQSGLLNAAEIRSGIIAILVASVLIGAYLVSVAGPALLIAGLAAIASAIIYTAGPFPLAYRGLGELSAFIFFGPIAVAGTALAASGQVTRLAWWLSIPQGLLAAGVLAVNNLRDLAEDKQTGKRTLAVRFGEHFAIIEYGALMFLAFSIPLYVVATRLAGKWCLLPQILSPFGLHLVIAISRTRGRKLNALLARTAILMLLFSLLLAAGLVAQKL